MESMSKIASAALDEITGGEFVNMSPLAITGLLNDFQYAWLKRLKISYRFEVLDLARALCNRENKAVFKTVGCRDTKRVRAKFSAYIKRHHKDDDRVIIGLTFEDGKIDARWIPLQEYLLQQSNNKSDDQ